MIDVQIVAGRCPEVFAECLRRLLVHRSFLTSVLVVNQTGQPLAVSDPMVRVFDNEAPRTFEENHNFLAQHGDSEYILFLDDDAFLFDEAIERVYEKIRRDQSIVVAGGANNQTFRPPGLPIPQYLSFENYRDNEAQYQAVATHLLAQLGTSWYARIFCPGNFLLTRRKAWLEYGKWDESYKNWGEEIDYILWGYERGLRTVVCPGIFFVHLGSTSRQAGELDTNIVTSAKHFLSKFPPQRRAELTRRMKKVDAALVAQFNTIIADNELWSDPDLFASSELRSNLHAHLAN